MRNVLGSGVGRVGSGVLRAAARSRRRGRSRTRRPRVRRGPARVEPHGGRQSRGSGAVRIGGGPPAGPGLRADKRPAGGRAGGGHSAAGLSTIEGGLVIDLAGLRRVRADPLARTATVQGGATWAEVDRETQAFGLATTGGAISTTGVGGLTLGGGIGHLMRAFGLSCDNVVSYRLVTADSRVIHVDRDSEPELDWALRGGGGNFGIVTEFTFRLHPVGPRVLAGWVVHSLDRARDVLRIYRDLAAAAPDELSIQVLLSKAGRPGGVRVPRLSRGPAGTGRARRPAGGLRRSAAGSTRSAPPSTRRSTRSRIPRARPGSRTTGGRTSSRASRTTRWTPWWRRSGASRSLRAAGRRAEW